MKPIFFNYLKNLRRMAMTVMVATAGLMISCEDLTETSPLVGKWQFTSAVVAADVPIGTTNYKIPANTAITPVLATALYAVANCSSLAKGAIELKANNTMQVVCLDNTTAIPNGTWSQTSASAMALNVLLPQAISLSITNLVTTSTSIKGTIEGLPITKATYGALLAPLDVSSSAFPAAILLTVNLEMTKVN